MQVNERGGNGRNNKKKGTQETAWNGNGIDLKVNKRNAHLWDSEKIGENAEIARNFRVLCCQTKTVPAIYYNINMVHIIILYKLLLDVGNADT